MSSARLKSLLCIFTASVFTLSSPVTAFGFQDFLQSAAEKYLPEGVSDFVPTGLDIAQKYLTDSLDSSDIDFDTIQKAIIDFMNSSWYSSATTEERIEQITNILELFGIDNSDIIARSIDSILSFSFDGQQIGIYLEDYTADLFDPSKWDAPEDSLPTIASPEELNKNAVILYGLGFEEIENYLTMTAESWTSHGLNTWVDTSCSVEDFKTELRDYDLIIIEEHGNFEGYGLPMICTTEAYSKASASRYADDLASGRVYEVICEDGTFYWLHPSFFTYYYGDGSLSDSLIWLGSCSGCKTDELSRAFLSCGADSVIGHSETVYTAYDFDLLSTSIARMIDGDDSDSALAYAKTVWGDNDSIYAREFLGLSSKEIKDCTSYPLSVGSVNFFSDSSGAH